MPQPLRNDESSRLPIMNMTSGNSRSDACPLDSSLGKLQLPSPVGSPRPPFPASMALPRFVKSFVLATLAHPECGTLRTSYVRCEATIVSHDNNFQRYSVLRTRSAELIFIRPGVAFRPHCRPPCSGSAPPTRPLP